MNLPKKKMLLIIVLCLSSFLILILFSLYNKQIDFKKDTGYYIQNYSKLKQADNNRVVISVSVKPEKIKLLRPFVNSILNQTVKVNELSLTLLEDEKYDIPAYFSKIFNIYRCKKDYCNFNNCIPTLLREGDKNTKLIILDEKYIYGKDFIEKIVNESNKNPNKAIFWNNSYLVKPNFFDIKVLGRGKNNLCKDWIKQHLKKDIIKMNYKKNKSYL